MRGTWHSQLGLVPTSIVNWRAWQDLYYLGGMMIEKHRTSKSLNGLLLTEWHHSIPSHPGSFVFFSTLHWITSRTWWDNMGHATKYWNSSSFGPRAFNDHLQHLDMWFSTWQGFPIQKKPTHMEASHQQLHMHQQLGFKGMFTSVGSHQP